MAVTKVKKAFVDQNRELRGVTAARSCTGSAQSRRSASLKKERIKKQIYKNRELALNGVPITSIASTIEPAAIVS